MKPPCTHVTSTLDAGDDGGQRKTDQAHHSLHIIHSSLLQKHAGDLIKLCVSDSISLSGGAKDINISDALRDEVADGLLAGAVSLSGRVARTEAGLLAENFRIGNEQVQILADGTYSSAVADFAFNLDLSDLALLSDQASGALSVVGTARGADSLIDLNLDATVADLGDLLAVVAVVGLAVMGSNLARNLASREGNTVAVYNRTWARTFGVPVYEGRDYGAPQADSNLPEAEITPTGELLIAGTAVDTTPAQKALLLEHRRHLEDLIVLEGAQNIAALILETIPGTAGIYLPPAERVRVW